MKPGEDNKQGQMNTNAIPSMRVAAGWYNDSGEASNCQSSVVTDDHIGLEMQQIASLFHTGHARGNNQGSSSFDNFPGIC